MGVSDKGLYEQGALLKKERKTTRKNVKSTMRKTGGILFLFMFIFAIIRDMVLFPIGSKLWSLAMATTPQKFLSDKNITDIFKSPLVIIIGLLLILCYSYLVLWQMAAIITTAEYAYQDKPLRFYEIFKISFQHIEHSVHPKNWPIFLLTVVIMPFIDLYKSTSMIGKLVIPEYIMDFINDHALLSLFYAVVVLALLYFCVRAMFTPYYYVLYQYNFSTCVKKSFELTKSRNLFISFEFFIDKILIRIKYSAIPAFIFGLIWIIASIPISGLAGYNSAFTTVLTPIAVPMIDAASNSFVTVATLILVLMLFRNRLEAKNLPAPMLQEQYITKDRKIHTFKSLIFWAYGIIFALSALMLILVTYAFTYDPNYAENFINSSKIAAHKGYSSRAPENTLPAFDLAIKSSSANYIELDVRESKDGIPILTHDDNFEKLSGDSRSVYDLTLDEIKTLNATGSFGEEFDGNEIATLEEALKMCQGKIDLIVEIKASDRSPDLERKIVELLEKYDYIGHCVIHSGNYESLCKVKAINPDIPCGLIMALSFGTYYDMDNVDFFSIEHNFVNDINVKQIHDAGKKIFAWTVNNTSDMNKMARMNVDCIICDYPEDAYEAIYTSQRSIIDYVNSIADDNTIDTQNSGYTTNTLDGD